MEIKTVLVIYAFILIVGGIRKCLANKYITVVEGETLVLKCPRRNFSESRHMEWRNPQGHVLFFNNHKGIRKCLAKKYLTVVEGETLVLKCPRRNFSESGHMEWRNPQGRLLFFNNHKGMPKIEMVEYKDKTIIKCTAEANGHPPDLSWQISGVEIEVEEHSTATDINLTTHLINSSETNSTEDFVTKNATDLTDFDRRRDVKESSPLLILLVTSLIIALLIVVIFFLIRLQKAHLAWKKENEESDQSVESSKSKSSHEEKQSQERRRQGFWNSNFTEYKVEEAPQNTANSVATVDVITETEDSSTAACNNLVRACVKETEL
ncbi:cytotoxic and regulatory T-cell molecule-like protein [Labeo rohita]|uniref:Cytotoxic and regulatory T-cell molecule-like protein n=1 Tax=Labeo rohita TaxID=84645 RepID=A0A498LTB2_LABRO|nr:cytotoxic and regulatory T-cell molecule-like protein [Labeo rohita]